MEHPPGVDVITIMMIKYMMMTTIMTIIMMIYVMMTRLMMTEVGDLVKR